MRTPAPRIMLTTAERSSGGADSHCGTPHSTPDSATPAAGQAQIHALPAPAAGAGLAGSVLRRADALAGVAVATDRQRGERLLPDLALPDLRRCDVAVLATLRSLDRVCGHCHGVHLAAGLPAGLLHGTKSGQVEKHPAGPGDRALL